jgi:hypothetical protein
LSFPRPEDLQPTVVFDSYWRFAAERLRVFYQIACGEAVSTVDPVISQYRFTNTYRAADRVSQYLIREVQYRGSQERDQVVARTLLFKLFNKIETWEVLRLDQPPGGSMSYDSIVESLDALFGSGLSVYNPAYIMSNPPFGKDRKHQNHIAMLDWIMREAGLLDAVSLEDLYRRLLTAPGLGKFLAFQFAIDLNYSSAFDFDESEFVVAGPGALDGISKCFATPGSFTPEQIIYGVTEAQWRWFAKLDIRFPGLYGRPLQPIDCQNLFCEISKYARVAHPDVSGVAGRTKIKQTYKRHPKPFPPPMFPPRWGLDPNEWKDSGL